MEKTCRIVNLYSGSGGNSTFIRVGNSAILIDAGKNAKALTSALNGIGESLDAIDAIFITHEHTDHVSALEVLSKKINAPIHITERSAEKFDERTSPNALKRMVLHTPSFSEQVGEMLVNSFPTPHDSRMSVGYRIEFGDGKATHAIGYATDIGYVSENVRKNLTGCEFVVIEANHDEDMLMTGPYPRELKLRVASKRGHLSNKDCAEFATELAESGTKAFMLAHLSADNNQPSIALDEVQSAVSGYGATVIAADQFETRELIFPDKENENCVECEVYNPWNA